ncbi:MAG: hypothetical protein ACLFVP_09935 [Candidatus Bathyarchaeia archaeon]
MISEMAKNKDRIIRKVVEQERKFIERTFDEVLAYLQDGSGGCGSGNSVCPQMIAGKFAGMPLVDEGKVRQVLDVMYKEGYLEREVPEGTGILHYSIK